MLIKEGQSENEREKEGNGHEGFQGKVGAGFCLNIWILIWVRFTFNNGWRYIFVGY